MDFVLDFTQIEIKFDTYMDISPRNRNQGRNKENKRSQAPQEYIWMEARI